MNQKQATAWADALRSGKYKQGYGNLKIDGYYCVYGVLCDISGVGSWELIENSEETLDNSEEIPFYYQYPGEKKSNCEGIISPAMKKHFNLKSATGKFAEPVFFDLDGDKFELDVLTEANDEGVTFDVMADFIEGNYAEL